MDTPDDPVLLRPVPRRPYETSKSTSVPAGDHDSDFTSQLDAKLLRQSRREHGYASNQDADESAAANGASASSSTPHHVRSFLNLTSSTLFGIYAPTASSGAPGDPSEAVTPWGTGAETPAMRGNECSPPLRGGEWTLRGSREWGIQPAPPSRAPTMLQVPSTGKNHAGGRGQNGGWVADGLRAAGRITVLFAFGVAYGSLISRLHDQRHIVPVRVEGIQRDGWRYTFFWGVAGVALGSLLPWVDAALHSRFSGPSPLRASDTAKPTSFTTSPGITGSTSAARDASSVSSSSSKTPRSPTLLQRQSSTLHPAPPPPSPPPTEWLHVVRSVGAFVGIAFAIRRLPWESTLQLSATLALANPALWYLLDRSRAGFALALAVGVCGTIAVLAVNPAYCLAVPHTQARPEHGTCQSHSYPSAKGPPHFAGPGGAAQAPNGSAQAVPGGGAPGRWAAGGNLEAVGAATWLGSVLFCSCVCFGSVGRRLAGR